VLSNVSSLAADLSASCLPDSDGADDKDVEPPLHIILPKVLTSFLSNLINFKSTSALLWFANPSLITSNASPLVSGINTAHTITVAKAQVPNKK
jgi:hypothetical protein